jgi:DNA-binding transcriptional LysR family regulator
MTDRLAAMRVFQRVAQLGNLSRAARDLGLSQPSVSRIVADLERDLGAVLFVRNTRALRLTDQGSGYLARTEAILSAVEEADRSVRGTGELRGALRVGVSTSLSVREIIPRLPEFLDHHPALRIELSIGDQLHDLITDGVDLALRAAPLSDSSVVARKIAETPRVLVASPGYLARAGDPLSPAELASHSFVLGPGAGQGPLRFVKDAQRASIRPEGRVQVGANEGAIAAAVAGLGITVSSLWGCRAEIERGVLVRLLEDWTLPPVELHAVFHSGRRAAPAVRALVAHLAGRF